ncbi:MAG: DUF3124 domain-containing protein [Desulfobacteraceae bacterium]|nr:DUF3124 domain-containing protein [Desulfobacteraceae bacterium]
MVNPGTKRLFGFVCLLVLASSCILPVPPASSEVRRMRGQTVYVPAYSHIYHGIRQAPFYLTVTLSVRNTDMKTPITLLAVDYYDTAGKLLKSYIKDEVKLDPIGSLEYVIVETEKSGGAGANFIVRWKADKPVSEPIFETVMIGTSAQQGISFTSRGRAIDTQD